MILFFALLILICFYKIQAKKEGIFEDYLSVEKTNSIRGVFILLIFLSHISGYITTKTALDNIYLFINGLIGQRVVTMFMLYSGYGVMESIQSRGADYVKGMPRRRILKTQFNFACGVILYAILDLLIRQGRPSFSIGVFLASLVGWESLGNSNWYIFAILVAYVATYCGFSMAGKDQKLGILFTSVLLVSYCAIMRGFKLKPVTIWYDTILCYPIGMGYR